MKGEEFCNCMIPVKFNEHTLRNFSHSACGHLEEHMKLQAGHRVFSTGAQQVGKDGYIEFTLKKQINVSV